MDKRPFDRKAGHQSVNSAELYHMEPSTSASSGEGSPCCWRHVLRLLLHWRSPATSITYTSQQNAKIYQYDRSTEKATKSP